MSGFVRLSSLDAVPENLRGAYVAIGNFDTLDDVQNHQFLMLDTSGPTANASELRTGFYEAGCSRSFDSYMRDLDFSPDGARRLTANVPPSWEGRWPPR